MVNDLQKQYTNRGKQTLFLEHSVDDRSDPRGNLWWTATGKSGSQQTPFVIVDSGFKYSNGSEDFQKSYTSLVDAALKNPPGAELAAYYVRRKDSFYVHVDVTNLLRSPLGYDNDARLDVLLYEDTQVIHVDRFVRQVARLNIEDDIPRNGSASFDIQMDVRPETRTNYSKSHVLVMLDYRPEGSRGFVSAQAALAVEGMPTPTAEPSPTPAPPTDTPAPTDEPSPTVAPTDPPTEPPTPEPTATTGPRGPVYLPYLLRE